MKEKNKNIEREMSSIRMYVYFINNNNNSNKHFLLIFILHYRKYASA